MERKHMQGVGIQSLCGAEHYRATRFEWVSLERYTENTSVDPSGRRLVLRLYSSITVCFWWWWWWHENLVK